MRIIVTGAAGFIGMHVAKKLLDRGDEILGIDNLNRYYDIKLKTDRIKQLKKYKKFTFKKIDINSYKLSDIFKDFSPHKVIHLAAQAGVRHSFFNAKEFSHSNLSGFTNVLECCRETKIKKLLYASSSSVYGNNLNPPFNEDDDVNNPLSFYAATKRSNELMAYSYSNIHKINTIGIRYFTVYGPWGRPDMSLIKFISKIKKREHIYLHNEGKMLRDFTYIDDSINGTLLLLDSRLNQIKKHSKSSRSNQTNKHFNIFNIGNSKPISLMEYIGYLEKNLNKKAKIKLIKKFDGESLKTHSSIKKINRVVNYKPKISINEGIQKTIKWYENYYKS